jgi:hypothetical protein
VPPARGVVLVGHAAHLAGAGSTCFSTV